MRIAVGGIAHETNTFSTVPTEYSDFRRIEGTELISGPGWDGIFRDDLAQGFRIRQQHFFQVSGSILTERFMSDD